MEDCSPATAHHAMTEARTKYHPHPSPAGGSLVSPPAAADRCSLSVFPKVRKETVDPAVRSRATMEPQSSHLSLAMQRHGMSLIFLQQQVPWGWG